LLGGLAFFGNFGRRNPLKRAHKGPPFGKAQPYQKPPILPQGGLSGNLFSQPEKRPWEKPGGEMSFKNPPLKAGGLSPIGAQKNAFFTKGLPHSIELSHRNPLC